ncbi:MAG: hypothetical protein K2Y23_15195 [Cyanobacteria bacterium]|nr:hypothetical protein [Cyanobacteriota bacterium]
MIAAIDLPSVMASGASASRTSSRLAEFSVNNPRAMRSARNASCSSALGTAPVTRNLSSAGASVVSTMIGNKRPQRVMIKTAFLFHVHDQLPRCRE